MGQQAHQVVTPQVQVQAQVNRIVRVCQHQQARVIQIVQHVIMTRSESTSLSDSTSKSISASDSESKSGSRVHQNQAHLLVTPQVQARRIH